jgi:hypothetical protein
MSDTWRIAINGQGVEITDDVRRLVEGDLRSVLEPHRGRIAFAHVRLWEPIDTDGPTTCYIRVDLRPWGGLALGATAPDLTKAIGRATERVGTAVRNQLAILGEGGSRASSSSWFRG